MLVLPITESSQAGEARRQLTRLAASVGLDETAAGRVALITTELATNLLKHATGGGVILCRRLDPPEDRGVEVLALDHGPGITDLGHVLRDGYSTAGTAGTGLGAVSRLSNLLDVHSTPGLGTAILARVVVEPSAATLPGLRMGAMAVPKPGEEVCGDAWAAHSRDGRSWVVVADGLGHGPGAATASLAAVNSFRDSPESPPAEAVLRIHDALSGTRGAAVAVVELDLPERSVRFAGIGNISGSIVVGDRSKGMVSHNGTAGVQVRKIQEHRYEWPSDGLLVLHSDGLVSRWDLTGYAGLSRRHPALIAGVMYRDFTRGRDDATVVVVSEGAQPARGVAARPDVG